MARSCCGAWSAMEAKCIDVRAKNKKISVNCLYCDMSPFLVFKFLFELPSYGVMLMQELDWSLAF